MTRLSDCPENAEKVVKFYQVGSILWGNDRNRRANNWIAPGFEPGKGPVRSTTLLFPDSSYSTCYVQSYVRSFWRSSSTRRVKLSLLAHRPTPWARANSELSSCSVVDHGVGADAFHMRLVFESRTGHRCLLSSVGKPFQFKRYVFRPTRSCHN